MPASRGDREQVQHAVRRAAGRRRRRRSRSRTPRGSGSATAACRRGRAPSRARPPRRAACGLAGMRRRDAARGRAALMPRKSITSAIVLAVNWPPHAPAPGHATLLERVHLLVGHLPGGARADRLEHVLDRHVAALGSGPARSSRCRRRARGCRAARAPSRRRGSSCRSRRGRRGRRTGGPRRRARSSRRSPRARSARRACPVVPIETPSETEIVLNSIGVPPAARMPSFTCSASTRWLRLHGIVSIQVVATPTSGFARSSSVKPTRLQHRARRRAVDAVGERGAAALGGIGRLRRRRSCERWLLGRRCRRGRTRASRQAGFERGGDRRPRRPCAAQTTTDGPEPESVTPAVPWHRVVAQLGEQRRVLERGTARAGGRGRRRARSSASPAAIAAPSSAACARRRGGVGVA